MRRTAAANIHQFLRQEFLILLLTLILFQLFPQSIYDHSRHAPAGQASEPGSQFMSFLIFNV